MSIQNRFPEKNENIYLKDDFILLDLMVNDSEYQSTLYKPGPYWSSKAKNSVIEIKRCGISDFRGSTNLIGLSYADNLLIDVRNSLNYSLKNKLLKFITSIYPFNKIYESQVRWTEFYAKESILYAQEILKSKDKTKKLLGKYNIPYSLLGNCQSKVKINDIDISIHYLNLLEQHDNISSHINFNFANSVFEIGGGFGANIHILLENYKNIRKVLYLDIPPNLYVGTQYLKAFYKDSVLDYRDLKNKNSINFSNNDDLEIFCITPWQIEQFEGEIDILMNSHSFVEMPKNVVKNYVDKFNNFLNSKDSAVSLTTYDCFDLNTTFHPNELPEFFTDKKFEYLEFETHLNSSSKNLFFISGGKLSI